MAAGLGGGSSDAAAALRALAEENGLPLDDPRCGRGASDRLGRSRLPRSATRTMRGRGDMLGPIPALPPLFAVLVNPRVAVATPAVFARLGFGRGGSARAGAAAPISAIEPIRRDACAPQGRNDMEAAASALAPAISQVLEALSARLAALRWCACRGRARPVSPCSTRAPPAGAHGAGAAHPDWWVRATLLPSAVRRIVACICLNHRQSIQSERDAGAKPHTLVLIQPEGMLREMLTDYSALNILQLFDLEHRLLASMP